MLSTARCKVQTHYGQVLAYKTQQTREWEQSLQWCSLPPVFNSKVFIIASPYPQLPSHPWGRKKNYIML